MIQVERERLGRTALLVALLLGAVIRGWHTWSFDFPLNDGGLFYVMVRDLQDASYRLPAYTSYNNANIPFGYSPLAFYVAGLLNDATGIDLFTLFRVLPFVVSTACIAAFHPLARDLLARELRARPARGQEADAPDAGAAEAGARDALTTGARADEMRTPAILAAALIAFTIVPRGFVWLLMGGGLTRSFGYLFALLALHQVWLLYTRRSLRYVPLAALCSALTVLSHLGTAPFVAFSALLFLVFHGRHREGVIGSMLVGAGTVLLAAPWWATVIAMHGSAPFLAARATGGSVLSSSTVQQPGALDLLHVLGQIVRGTTGEGWYPLIWLLAVGGIVWCLRERRVLIPVWLASILLLDTRAGFTYAAAPVAMLAGIGIVNLLWPVVRPRERSERALLRRRAAFGVLGLLVVVSIVAAARPANTFGAESSVLTPLGAGERAAMQWTAMHTDSAARVLVLTRTPWQVDKASEWFPVLARRTSVATVQGSEWLPAGAFPASIRRQLQLMACSHQGTSCLNGVMSGSALHFTHVYVPTNASAPCCGPLLHALERDPRFAVIFRNDAATIFARQDREVLSERL
jgi:hypothetical protein